MKKSFRRSWSRKRTKIEGYVLEDEDDELEEEEEEDEGPLAHSTDDDY